MFDTNFVPIRILTYFIVSGFNCLFQVYHKIELLLTSVMDFVPEWKTGNHTNQPVFGQPTILQVELIWELSNLCTECVRIFHWSSSFSFWCVRHFARFFFSQVPITFLLKIQLKYSLNLIN